jgi:hypothetical protein
MSKIKKTQRRAFKKKFNLGVITSNTSYSVDDVRKLFKVGQNTVRNWIKMGLKVSDDKFPAMIHCEELRSFLKLKQSANKQKCNQDEMFCFSCRAPHKIAKNAVILLDQNDKVLHLKGRCESCESFMTRKYAASKMEEIQHFFTLSVNYQLNT